MENIKSKLKSLPKKPGVYLFRDSSGHIIYIGKALSLKDRVSSYFRQKSSSAYSRQRQKDAKTNELLKNIADLEFILVNSEFEALFLEAQLIKQHSPKYNTALKDGKSYLYIAIGKNYPNRIFLARRPELENDLLEWFGPFTTSSDAHRILKTIRRIFPFRSCKNLPKKPCLYYHLRLCPGVCFSPTKTYPQIISRIKQILSGKIITLINSLEKEMKKAAKEEKFENAQILKNQIYSLRSLTSGWRSIPKEKQEISKTLLEIKKMLVKYQKIAPTTINKIEGYDVSNLGKDIIVGSMAAFVNGEPDKSQYRKFNLKYNLAGQDDPEGIKQIIRRRLNHPEWIYPQILLVDGGKIQVSAAFSAIKKASPTKQIAVLGLAKENEALVIPKIINDKIFGWQSLRLSRNSSVLQLFQAIRDEAHRFAQKFYKQKHSKHLLTK